MTEEMSFQVSLEHFQGFSIPDVGGKFIPPARNGEWMNVEEINELINKKLINKQINK